MMSRKLPEVCEIQYGFPFDSSLFSAEGDLPLIRIRDVVRGYTETYTSEKCDVAYLVHEGDILVGMDGVFNVAKWKGEPAYLNQRVCRIIPNETIDADFLFYFIPTALKKIENETAFVTVKHLKAKQLNAVVVPDVPIEEQKKIAAQLNVITDLIFLRQRQAEKLDELVKARFVEMFGDPVLNCLHTAARPMTEICQIIDGDRGKNYPKADDFFDKGDCLFLNAKNVTKAGFNFDECMFITKDKDNVLRKGKLQRGDIILTTRGTIGNLAFYTDDVPYSDIRINSGMVILRMNREYINPIYFIEQFKMQLENIKRKIASGTAQPQLPISTMNKIKVIIPDIRLQANFANFVHEVDREKERIQRSAVLLETLKRSLMQQYFG